MRSRNEAEWSSSAPKMVTVNAVGTASAHASGEAARLVKTVIQVEVEGLAC